MSNELNRGVRGVAFAALLCAGAVAVACGGSDADLGSSNSSSSSSSGALSSSSSSSSSGASSSSSSSGSGDSGADTGIPTVASPTFTTSPSAPDDGGPYTGAVDVTVSETTAGATLYYTTNGSTPTTGSVVVTGPIHVSTNGSTTIQVLAAADGYQSATASFVVTISIPPDQTAPVVFGTAGGTFDNTFNLALSTPTAGATICYTTSATAPTCTNGVCDAPASTYSGGSPVPIGATNTTVSAIACKAGGTTTDVGTATYTLRAGAAVPNPAPPGNFTQATDVVLSTTTQDGIIHYTTDGTTTPTCTTVTSGTNSATVTVSSNTDIKTIVCKDGFDSSAVGDFSYGAGTAAPILVTGNDNAQIGGDPGQSQAPNNTTYPTDTRFLIPNAANAQGTVVDTRPGARLTGDVDCYTTDGTDPVCTVGTATCGHGTRYVPPAVGTSTTNNGTVPVLTKDQEVIKLIRCRTGSGPSVVASYTYGLKVDVLSASYVTRSSTGTGTLNNNVLATASAQNDTTSTAVITGAGTNTELVGGNLGNPTDHGFDAVQTGTGSTSPGALTTSTEEKICYTVNTGTPTCTQTATAVTCGTGSTDDAVTPVGSSTYASATQTTAGGVAGAPQRPLPVTLHAIGCKLGYQNSPQRDIQFGAANTSISVIVDATNPGPLTGGAYPNDLYLTFTPSQAIAGTGAICYNRGGTTLPDPSCNANKSGCTTGYLYDGTSNNTKPHVTSDTSAANHFSVIACKPGTSSSVQDLGTYTLRVNDPTASVNGTPITSPATIPGGSVVTFSTTTTDTTANAIPAAGGPGGAIAAAPVHYCTTSGATAPANPGCSAAGVCAAGSTDGASVSVNANQEVKVIACKGNGTASYQASDVGVFDLTVQGFGAPTFDLGTGNQLVYVRTGQSVTITRPNGTTLCTTTDGTTPNCALTSCSNASNPMAVAITFPAVVTAQPPSTTVKAISCSGQQASAEVDATYTLADSPVVVSAVLTVGGGAVPTGAVPSNPGPRVNNTAVAARSSGIDISISTESTPGVTSVANEGTYNASRPRRPTVGGSICYTLDGSLPAFTVRNRATAQSGDEDLDSALPLNGADSGPSNGDPGCIADVDTNPATVCLRNTSTTATAVDKTRDPRLGNVSSSVNVRAVQCKNPTYQVSDTTAAQQFTFTPYAHTIAFNGTPDALNPDPSVPQSGWYTNGVGTDTKDNNNNGGEDFPVSPVATSVVGTDILYATWDATYIYLGVSLATLTQSGQNFLQIYVQGGDISPVNALQHGTYRSEPIFLGANSPPEALVSPIGWPSGTMQSNGTGDPNNKQIGCTTGSDCQRLPFPVDFHIFMPTSGLTTGTAASNPMTTNYWDGAKWIANASVADAFSATANYAEIKISRTGLLSPDHFYAVGAYADMGTPASSRALPAGAGIDPGTVQDVPNNPTAGSPNPSNIASVGYLRLNLGSFRYPDYYVGTGTAATVDDPQSLYRKPTDTYATDPRTSAPLLP